MELIPVFSFVFQGGKCKNCHKKINPFYPLCELTCGILFALAYLRFGFHPELVISLTFISLVVVIIVSDYNFMIISDESLFFFGGLLIIENFLFYGLSYGISHLISGGVAFLLMYLLGCFGDFLFKRESLGGGDIKLMFVIGCLLGGWMAFVTIFVASFLALPVACLVLLLKKDHLIPYGPFLAIGALLLYFSQIHIMDILTFLGYIPM